MCLYNLSFFSLLFSVICVICGCLLDLLIKAKINFRLSFSFVVHIIIGQLLTIVNLDFVYGVVKL